VADQQALLEPDSSCRYYILDTPTGSSRRLFEDLTTLPTSGGVMPLLWGGGNLPKTLSLIQYSPIALQVAGAIDVLAKGRDFASHAESVHFADAKSGNW